MVTKNDTNILSSSFEDPDVGRAGFLLEVPGENRFPGLFRLPEAPAFRGLFHVQSQGRSVVRSLILISAPVVTSPL